MSTVKTNNLQLGQSLTATNNFSWYQPSSPDGTVRLGNGNSGSVTDLVTVNSSGNVGIGTSSPATKLQVSGAGSTPVTFERTGSNGVYLQLKDASGSSVFLGASNGVFAIQTPGSSYSDKLLIDSSGNLGLGVTPSGWTNTKAIDVGGFGSISTDTLNDGNVSVAWNAYATAYNTWKYKNIGAASRYAQEAGKHYWFTAPSGTAGNAISFTQAMTLDSSGNLLVGTTSSTASPAKGCQLAGTGNGAIAIGHDTGALSGYYYASFAYNGSVIGSITQNGTTAVAYNTSSDERLKENIVDAPSAIDSVNKIKVRSFDWKADGSHVDYGYIAQELLEIVPEAVSVSPDADQMMGVDFGKLTPRLVKAIQELSAQVTTLQAEINALKA